MMSVFSVQFYDSLYFFVKKDAKHSGTFLFSFMELCGCLIVLYLASVLSTCLSTNRWTDLLQLPKDIPEVDYIHLSVWGHICSLTIFICLCGGGCLICNLTIFIKFISLKRKCNVLFFACLWRAMTDPWRCPSYFACHHCCMKGL